MLCDVFVSGLRGFALARLVDCSHPPLIHLTLPEVAHTGLAQRPGGLGDLEEVQVVLSLLLDNIMRDLPPSVKSRRLPSQEDAKMVKT